MGGGWRSSSGESGRVAKIGAYADSAQLYCQNLSLFGKLFIDHKVSQLCFTSGLDS